MEEAPVLKIVPHVFHKSVTSWCGPLEPEHCVLTGVYCVSDYYQCYMAGMLVQYMNIESSALTQTHTHTLILHHFMTLTHSIHS